MPTRPRVAKQTTVNVVCLVVYVVLTGAFPAVEDVNSGEATLGLTETRSAFAALDDVRLVANGLLQLGKNLRDFVQKTKGQIDNVLQKINVFDQSFQRLSAIAGEIREEEQELKKTTVELKANNEEIKSLSLEINSKVEDIKRERVQLRDQVEGLEQAMSGLSQGLLSAEQAAEISSLKEMIQTQERSISELLRTVKAQSEHLSNQKNKIKSLENKLNSATLQETSAKFRSDGQTYRVSDYLSNNSTDGSFSSDFPQDCGEIFRTGEKPSGLYPIKPNQSEPFLVYCEFTEEGAFTIIQRRQDGSVDFNQSWQSYEDGFGDFRSDFWLGLKKIFTVASQGNSLLRFQTEDWRQEKHSMEFQYTLEGPESSYKIHLKSVDPTSDMEIPTGMCFSTRDHNDGTQLTDPNCALDYTGGWWFSACGDVNLNGKSIQSRARRKGVQGKHSKGQPLLKSSQISIHHLKET